MIQKLLLTKHKFEFKVSHDQTESEFFHLSFEIPLSFGGIFDIQSMILFCKIIQYCAQNSRNGFAF
jgi:hypothetical protein